MWRNPLGLILGNILQMLFGALLSVTLTWVLIDLYKHHLKVGNVFQVFLFVTWAYQPT